MKTQRDATGRSIKDNRLEDQNLESSVDLSFSSSSSSSQFKLKPLPNSEEALVNQQIGVLVFIPSEFVD